MAAHWRASCVEKEMGMGSFGPDDKPLPEDGFRFLPQRELPFPPPLSDDANRIEMGLAEIPARKPNQF